jgi:hypothetical protein
MKAERYELFDEERPECEKVLIISGTTGAMTDEGKVLYTSKI